MNKKNVGRLRMAMHWSMNSVNLTATVRGVLSSFETDYLFQWLVEAVALGCSGSLRHPRPSCAEKLFKHVESWNDDFRSCSQLTGIALRSPAVFDPYPFGWFSPLKTEVLNSHLAIVWCLDCCWETPWLSTQPPAGTACTIWWLVTNCAFLCDVCMGERERERQRKTTWTAFVSIPGNTTGNQKKCLRPPKPKEKRRMSLVFPWWVKNASGKQNTPQTHAQFFQSTFDSPWPLLQSPQLGTKPLTNNHTYC